MLYHALATIEKSAVGNHAIAITEELRKQEVPVELFAETIRPEFVDSVTTIDELDRILKPNDIVFYQFANPSPMADLLYERNCRVIINYHNVTPAHYFSKWSPQSAQAISRARLQLSRLAEVSSAAVAVSEYNATELIELGYRNVEVIPPVFSEDFYAKDIKSTSGKKTNWLYVGRIAPHKNIHILLRAFEFYLNNFDSKATLTIVGSTDTPVYGQAISELISTRNFGNALSIIERCSSEDLVNIYAKSSVFVTASEHEGFCVPLIEAMSCGIPVVAVAKAAVADTVGSAGVLVADPEVELIASAVKEVEENDELRDRIISNGHVRSEYFDPRNSVKEYVKYLKDLS